MAYNDNDAVNTGNLYRTAEGVDIEPCSEGGYNVGWNSTGEWLEYTVNVVTAGTYNLQVRVATPNAGKTIHVELNGVNISGTINLPNTGGWQTWQTVSVTTPALTTGQKVLKIAMDSYDFNINYLAFSLNSTPAVPVVSSAATASGIIGTAFNYIITASNSPTSYGATGLPAGLNVNTSTGVINGIPITAGTYNVTVRATNAGGTGTKTVAITITSPTVPVVSSASTASGTVGTAFSYNITASNSPTSYSAIGLPAGLSVNTSTGAITGSPTAAGIFNATVNATNAGGTGTKAVTISIVEAPGVITCYRAPGTITIDGNLNENGWKITRSFSKNVTGAPNNTATFGVLWDNTNLYVGIKVIDANLYSESANIWDDDAVEIYIDANYNRSTTYDGKDNQILKGYNKTTVSAKFTIAGLQHAWAAVSGGYAAEFAIPWSQLGITAPAAATRIGFDVGYDDDDNGGARDGQAVWNGTINNYQNTSGFGTLTLNATISSGTASRPVNTIATIDESMDVNTLKLMPNPVTNGVLIVDADELKGDVLIEIRDFQGGLMLRETRNVQNEKLNINVGSLNAGAYIILLKNNDKIISGKFLVK
ncbi:MAG: sugar-binding protein [Bacteroidota bacterium]